MDFEKVWERFVEAVQEDSDIILGRKGWNKKVRQIAERRFPEILPYVEWSETRRVCDKMFGNYSLRFMINEDLLYGEDYVVGYREVLVF